MSAAGQSLFQTLKPACVALGETALKFRRGDASGHQLCSALRQLYHILANIDRPGRRVLDGRLAEYVFFPVSQVFRERSSAPLEALELACKCLQVLLDSAWQSVLAPELGHQLMILLTFLAGGSLSDGDEQPSAARTSEELQTLAFDCEAFVFTSVGRDRASREAFLETDKIPAIGHAVSVLLDAVKGSTSREVGLSSTAALQAFLDRIATKEVAASFLPGIVSAASHVLTPNTKLRRPYHLIVASLSLLRKLLVTVFSDLDVPARPKVSPTKSGSELVPKLDDAWFKGNASQVKVALASTVKLGRHDRKEVRATLLHLCIDILSKCSLKLSDSIEMLLDASILLVSSPDLEQSLEQLQDHILTNQHLQDALSSISYDWFTSMPRIMLSSDEQKKKDIASKLILGQKLLLESGVETAYLDSVIMTNLRDSLSSALSIQAKSRLKPGSTVDPISTSITIPSQDQEPMSTAFPPTLSGNEQVNDSIGQIERVVGSIGSSPRALTIARQALENARMSDGRERLTSMWLALNLLRSNANVDDLSLELLNLEQSDDSLLIFDELFSLSLSILNDDDSEGENDWRLKALALEAVALTASIRQQDFRTELVDVLYTIVDFMGSSIEPLRNHAITCINSIALSCGYVDAKDLLVSNADYLVNSIGLKIDSFDLSPQVSQVLSMTITLAGSSIVPYLDDVVGSIFGALDCFHEYSLLTEVLFTSLDAVVTQGVKTNPLTIENTEQKSHRKPGVEPTPMSVAAKFVQSRAQKIQERQHSAPTSAMPHRPWKELDEVDKGQPSTTDANEDHKDEAEQETPTSRTYELIKRITVLTQHHLPSSSPSLRMSLLNLLSKSLPYLALHEDSFLPLVHILWPVLVPRLSDPETYIVAGVLTVLSKMCEGAGDFMSGRIDELWPTLRRLHKLTLTPDVSHTGTVNASSILKQHSPRRQITSDSSTTSKDLVISPNNRESILTTSQALDTEDSMRPKPYQSTTTKLLRRSLTNFLVSLLTFVRMQDARVNEIVDHMLNNAMIQSNNSEAKAALKARNPDAFWLAMEFPKFNSQPSNSWTTHKPPDVDGAPPFVQVVF